MFILYKQISRIFFNAVGKMTIAIVIVIFNIKNIKLILLLYKFENFQVLTKKEIYNKNSKVNLKKSFGKKIENHSQHTKINKILIFEIWYN